MDRAIPTRPRDLLVSGHLNVDRFLEVDRFPDADRTVPILAHRVELGGTGANIARVASEYGVASGLVARVGRDFPGPFLQVLRHARIDLRGVERVATASTPTCFIVEDRNGRHRTLIDQGPMDSARDARVPGAWLGEYSYLHLTTADPAFQLRLMRAARARGVRVVADPAQEIHYRWNRRRFVELLSGSELLFGNRAEVDRAVEYVGGSHPTSLLARVPLVVRTEGPRGATAFSRSGTVHVPAERSGSIRSTVGAGDAFRGGFYAAWFEGEPLRSCLTAGVRASRRWIERAS
jgi:sugar/nucleoside kinase (ribokinase family)